MGFLSSKGKKKKLRKQARRQEEAGRAYQSSVQFKPVGTTNAFGTTQYTYNPQGQLETAGYQLDPRLSGMSQNAINAAGSTGLQFANTATQSGLGLANLGAQYIATSPQEAAAKYMADQQALLQPGQDYARAQLNQGLFNTGRGGLSVEQGGGIGAANPEATAYYNALARQQAEMAMNSDLYGRQRVAFGGDLTTQGLGLGSSAYDPMKSNLVAAQGVEGLGNDILSTGITLGKLRTGAAQVGAEGMLLAQNAANQLRAKADMQRSGLGKMASSAVKGAINYGLNSAMGGLYGAAGGGGGMGGSPLGNWASNAYPNSIFGPGIASTQEIYSPQNQGFYGSAAQPAYYGGDTSQYSGLSWNRP